MLQVALSCLFPLLFDQPLLIELLALLIRLPLCLRLALLIKLLPLLLALRGSLLDLLRSLLLEGLPLFRRAACNAISKAARLIHVQPLSRLRAVLRNGNVSVCLECVRSKQHLWTPVINVKKLLAIAGCGLAVLDLRLHGRNALLTQGGKLLWRGRPVQPSRSTVVAGT